MPLIIKGEHDPEIIKSYPNKEKCKSFKNIKYIDTSENREEVLNQILEEIEEKI